MGWTVVLARELFKWFEPYAWEPSNRELASLVGLRPEEIVRLDTNASPYFPRRIVKTVLNSAGRIHLNHYPDTSYSSLRDAISRYVGVSSDCIVPTNGADEGIDIVTRTFVESGDEVIAPTPTYGYFRVSSELQGAKFVRVSCDENLMIDLERLVSSVTKRTRLIFLCNPNNPTGQLVTPNEIRKLCSSVDVPILVDEAYYEFCGVTALDLTGSYPNLIIVRTLSKAFGLAGIRIGYLLACEETVRLLNKVRPPNSLGVINMAIAERALRNCSYVGKYVRRINEVRDWLYRGLSSLDGLEVLPSKANFLFVRLRRGSANDLWMNLLREGIVVRNLSGNPLTENCLRITIGTLKHARTILRTFEEYLSEVGG